MKKHTLLPEILIFSLILLGCIVPPFFTNSENVNSQAFVSWNFPWQALFHGFFAVVLFVLSQKLYKNTESEATQKYFLFFHILIPATFCFAALFSISLLFKFISVLLKVQNSLFVKKPDSILSVIFCLLLFGNSAFYEEVIYRFYFPEALLRFIKLKSQNKILFFFAELSSALVFAFAHLYSGYLSVINAFAAHIILRICYKKSGNLWAGFAAHFLYNIISLILL